MLEPKSIDEFQGVENTRKYKDLINSLYELQDKFHQKYPTYKLEVNVNHNAVKSWIEITLRYTFESFTLGQQYRLNKAMWDDLSYIDNLASGFRSESYFSALQRAMANKVLVGPEEVRKYEEEAIAFEEKAWHEANSE